MSRDRKAPESPGELRRPDAGDGDETGSGAIQEAFRKMMGLGLAGFFSTEAAVRGALGDAVPREWVEFVSDQGDRAREEFARAMAEELGRVLEQVDLVDLASELLEGRTVEVKAEIRLQPRNRDPFPGTRSGGGESE